MNKHKKDIRAFSLEELTTIVSSLGEKPFRAKQLYEWLWKKGVGDFEAMRTLPALLKQQLSEDYTICQLEERYAQKSEDGTYKLGFVLHDQALIEGVLIPAEDRTTACISTQVGCAMNCSFCATAQLGFNRNLSAGEIYDQVFRLNKLSEKHYKRKLSNIVVMGMGEPLLNYKAVMSAIDMICSNAGMGMSPSRITLSTVGIPKMIRQLADDKVKFNLALSLHAPTNEIRSKIIPANINHPLEHLVEAFNYFYSKTLSRITIEYLLLDGVNDSLEDAAELARFCKHFPVKINLIEYNKVEGIPYRPSHARNVEQFVQFLEKKNLIVHLRRSRGKDIDAACGQLANKKK